MNRRTSRRMPALVAAVTTAAVVTTLAPWSATPSWSEGVDTGTGTTGFRNLIQGVVVDQTGKKVDDVTVKAVNRQGEVVASSLTYASDDNDIAHGYFALWVKSKQVYTLKLRKEGYDDVSVHAGWVARGNTISMGEVEMPKDRVASKTKGSLKDDSIQAGDQAKVEVSVTSDATSKPTGKVKVKTDGEVVGSGELQKDDSGDLVIKLDKLGRGTWDLKVFYLGSPYLKPSDSKKLELTVKKKR